jgi:large subunit ribosomal protein L16
MLIPTRVKRRKQHKPKLNGRAARGNKVVYGEYGLMSLGAAWVTNRQIEAARIAMTRYIKRGGKVWINIFPDRPITAKPAETRMGSGKGSPEYWVAAVKPDRVMFELAGVSEEVAREALRLAAHKLPVKCKFVRRVDQAGETEQAAFEQMGETEQTGDPEQADRAEQTGESEQDGGLGQAGGGVNGEG